MTKTTYQSDLGNALDNQTVTMSHFGANIVASTNTATPDGPFELTTNHLGVESLRYPGGTVTEQYFDPLGSIWEQLFGPERVDYVETDDGKSIVGPDEFFEYATNNGMSVTIVLPTASLLKINANGETVVDQVALSEVQATVAGMLGGAYGEVTIDQFELGNEYYYYADMTAEEYGMVANELTLALSEEFDAYKESGKAPLGWEEPDIVVQAGAAWQDGDNQDIIDSLEEDARAEIDGVSVHYYPEDLDQVNEKDGNLNQINEWNEAEGFGQLDSFVSEWNIYGSGDGDTGMAQASSLISGFEEMIVEGVDEAAIWGVQFRYSDSALSTIDGYDKPGQDPEQIETRLTPAGEIFASLVEATPGLTPFDPNLDLLIDTQSSVGHGADDPEADIVVNAFGSEENAVVYISSRSDDPVDIDFELDRYFGDVEHAWGEVLTTVDDPSTPSINESDPNSPNAIPQFDTLTEDELTDPDGITLSPYEILRVSVQLDDGGVTMLGHDPMTEDSLDFSDTFIGSGGDDSIHGYAGNDSLYGGDGNDVLDGGDANDELEGGGGRDVLRGGEGNDLLRSDWADDILSGNEGSDILNGAYGNDMLSGGAGNDILQGGVGNDTLIVGEDDDHVFGGKDADYFVVSPDGKTIIEDWSFEDGDQITFLGQFKDFADLAAHSHETAGKDGEPGDLVITNESDHQTVIVGGEGHLEDLEKHIVDFSEEGIKALSLADDLNGMSGEEISSLLDSMDTEEFNSSILDADKVILLSNLDPKAAAHFLNSMTPEETSDFLADVGKEGLGVFLEDLQEEEIDEFVSTVSSSSLVAIIDQYGTDETQSLIDECPDKTEASFFDKLEGTKYERLDPVDQWATEEDDPLPQQPIKPDDENEYNDESEYSSSESTCFVASVAYKDKEHPDVWLLRWFRDNIMSRSGLGRVLIATYWVLGPHLAKAIYDRPSAIFIFRSIIGLIVSCIAHIYGRQPGRQPDHVVCDDSRLITFRRRNLRKNVSGGGQ